MSARLIVESTLLPASVNGSTVTEARSSVWRVSRATPEGFVTLKIDLSGSKSGLNVLTIGLEQVPNPNASPSSWIYAPVSDTDVFPTLVINQDEAEEGFLRTLSIPTAGGVYVLHFTVTGRGDNTFQFSAYVSP
jgi:hypothetical protein